MVRAARGSSLAGAGVLLAAVSVLANALGYGLTVVLTRSFGAAEYGALGALLGAALIGGIPAGGLQYVLARRTAAGRLPAGSNERDGLTLALKLGGALAAVLLVASPLGAAFLHLGTVWPVVWLAAMMVPFTVGGALQGGLLGHERYGPFALAQLIAAVTRFGAGVVTALLGLSVSGAMAALAAGTLVSSLVIFRLTGPRSWHARPADRRRLLPDLAHACSTIAGIIVLSNVDLLLARHFLTREESGVYALASLFAKACLWGAQFVPVLVFPRLSRERDGMAGRGLVLAAGAAAAGVGAVGILLALGFAGPIVRVVAGDDTGYAATVSLAVPFAVLGTLWALIQLALFVAVAREDPLPGRLLWLAVAAETAVIAAGAHRTPGQLLTVCIATSALLLAATATRALRHTPTAIPADAPLATPTR